MDTGKIRVLLIEDSGFMRILISEILRQDKDLSIVATASNGKEGVEKVLELKPDVVITDVMMPEYDGLYVVRSLAKNSTIPVILLSSLERNDQQIFESLRAGAFDFVDKPTERQRNAKDYPLIPLIKAAAQGRKTTDTTGKRSSNINHHTFNADLNYDIVVIGASTGGPGALEFIIDNLPKNFAVPVVIAQHMPERFLQSFAERLNDKGIFPIKLAVAGETPEAGHIYIAAGQENLRIEREHPGSAPRFSYTSKNYPEFNHPSIDCLFESASDIYGERIIAAVLTGMGKDGMKGLQKIKRRGGYTLAQDESTSVVYGMPRAAFEAGAVNQILKLPEIPGFIVSCLS